MKKCRRCSKPATLHITEIREGAAQELHLCEACAQDYLSNSDPAEPVEESAEPAFFPEVEEDDLDELDQLTCPNCGISFRDFRSQGRLGCPHDYLVFKDELLPLMENIHGETQHCGKFPRRAPDSSQRQFRLIKLRNELRTFVEEEQYEAAAKLRDEIQTLETELSDDGSESE